ncbi:hypothetical protein OU798_08000 [Prolixibacteraceae bacterium Z1-6]|uniref:Cupin domain-containing protein n=1 Tax=Draconibacterium aestuarii TaxID=2998507 RepID=A0A9X3J5T8_9BACT|nr:hypothetical protein [Prolixibacteraceae bacterium Z1-6]
MKIKKEDITVVKETPGMILRKQEGFGGHTIAYHELPKGTDFTPLLKGLTNDLCHCPHWGYLFEGSMQIIYHDGSEEVISAGEAFYLPGGHTLIVKEDIKLMDFSPTTELNEVFANVEKRMTELG